ncbi:hypothetical protein HOLleu_10228 [Holothuria leucospilota]|uniref:Uncharacterized protein n=1 Tax=Holothuria leucospilota TaxID=206669 RepID=A0A9Q1HFJ7_HOLLE|nr:hypothetical protein HOLleu_10228 [Holothuria leucospilota]
MLGFSQGFTANYFCRFCRGHRQILQKQVTQDENLLRTKENYEDDLEQNDLSLTGIREPTVLNNLDKFHVIENVIPDVMHDFLEGIIPLEMFLVLSRLVEKEMITLEELNSRISCFGYGFIEQKNRPSPIKHTSILNPTKASGQTASQMMCSAPLLPLMIGDQIEDDCDEWALYLLLIDIFKIVMSPSLSLSSTYVLKALITDINYFYNYFQIAI